jgi:hypothetical protein
MGHKEALNIGISPAWANALPDLELLEIIANNENTEQVTQAKEQGKGICYIYDQKLRTTNERNEIYYLRVWDLNQSDLLQSASIQDHTLGTYERLVFHRVSVVRNGKWIDKIQDLRIRILDDDQNSGRGTIHKKKKVNCVIDDLRIGDVLVLEHTKTNTFTEKRFIDKKYWRFTQILPDGHWFFSQYKYSVRSERAEDLCMRKRFFRDEKGNRLPEEDTIMHTGDVFSFEKVNFRIDTSNDVYTPLFEVATVATWSEIAAYLDSLYGTTFTKNEKLQLSGSLSESLRTAKDTEEKIRLIIEYVQDQIVYLYDADLMHEHIPQSSQETLDKKAGDCKAKSMLLIGLLNSIDVESYFLLVNYSFDHYIDECIPSPFVFDHAIVKIIWNGKEYFVDPTASNQSGLLEYRDQPFFSTYLQIENKSELRHKSELFLPGINIEETTNVVLNAQNGHIDIKTIYRRESADITRRNFRTLSKEDVTGFFNMALRNRLNYDKDQDEKELFEAAEYAIVSDDKNKNEVTVAYKAKLLKPYEKSNLYLTFRYYYPFEDNNIMSMNHKDAHIVSLMGYPSIYSLSVKGSLPPVWWNKITRRNIEIDNKYFHFANKKKIGLRTIGVTSEFSPKTYGVIHKEDLHAIREDIRKIRDSNYGVGIVYFYNVWGVIVSLWRYVFIAIWVMALLIGAIGANSAGH